MKIKGWELQLWMDQAWPGEDWYWDHDAFDASPDPSATYDTEELGPLLFQGDRNKFDEVPEPMNLAKLIRRWRNEHGKVARAYLIPEHLVDAIDVLMKRIGAHKVGG